MLRPAIQPGSTIDYRWPEEEVAVHFSADRDFSLKAAPQAAIRASNRDGQFSKSLTLRPRLDEWLEIELAIPTSQSPAQLQVWWTTQEDNRPRVLALHRMLLPWARIKPAEASAESRREIPELAGGKWSRGRRVFFDDQVGCAKCHQFGGEGGTIGPDLTNLPQRDYDSVMRDIRQPSIAFNPDYLPYLVTLKDGRVLSGTIRSEGEFTSIGATGGAVTKVRRDDIEDMQVSSVSIMPEELEKQLGRERFRDLLTFLLTVPPHMPDYGP
jgi:putative heme-binding domain-containing protein